MEPYAIKNKVKTHTSTDDNYADIGQGSSQEPKMDGSLDCKFLFSTPHISRKDEIPESATMSAQSIQSFDSGFSDGTFNSTWTSSIKDMSSLSEESIPESERRHTLIACEFSPINRRLSSGIPGRRLKFAPFDLQPFLLSQTEECVQEAGNSLECEGTDSLCMEDAESVAQSQSCSILHDCYSTSSSPQSVVDDGLEASLHEMALDVSPFVTSRASPVNHIPANCPEGWYSHLIERKDTSLLWPLNDEIRTIPKYGPFHSGMSGHCLDKFTEHKYLPEVSQPETPSFDSLYSSSQESASPDFEHKAAHNLRTITNLAFHKGHSLTPMNLEEFQQQTDGTTVSEQRLRETNAESAAVPSEIVQFNKIMPKSDYLSIPTRIPSNRNKYILPKTAVNQICKCGFSEKNIDNHKFLACMNTVKNTRISPNKRCSCCYEDHGLLFSPTKFRKTEIIYNPYTGDGRSSLGRSPKNSSRKIMHEKEESVPALENDLFKFGCERLYNLHLPDWPHNEAYRQKYGVAGTIFKEELINCKHFYSRTNSHQLETDFNIVDSVLEKVIQKYSPSEPTRLIGRNIGVRNVDIIQKLHSQNIRPCLGKIFQYLASTDLLSVVSVSNDWKLALYSDLKTYSRYKQHKRNLVKSNVQYSDGKENLKEKTTDAAIEQSLTESRGLLSSIQSQAERKIVVDPPPIVAVKDTLMSDDALRICPHCQGPALIKHNQDRATCMNDKCSYDFCTLCFSTFHHPQPCKPLCKASSRGDVAGTKKSKKNLKRL